MPTISDQDELSTIPDLTKSDRPPLLKKPKTVDDVDHKDEEAPPHFPDSVFPAVRRAPPFPDLRVSVHNHVPATSSDVSATTTFSDRDWVYPSFLGAYPAKARVSIKPSSKSQHNAPAAAATSSTLTGPASIDLKGKKTVSTKQRNDPNSSSSSIATTLELQLSKKDEEEEEEKDVRTALFSQPISPHESTSSSYSSSSQSASTTTWGLKLLSHSSLIIVICLLGLFCILLVCYGVNRQRVITRLQEENCYLRTLCNVSESCNVFQTKKDIESSTSFWQKTDSRTVALYTVVVTLVMPFVLYKYLDHLPQLKKLSGRMKNNTEEVPLKKRIAYTVDVCFSLYPYAKLLALLFATIFLIGFGGLALYAVGDGSLLEALWLSWTFVADSGNHADSVGTGQRIVSVSISSGGMLIFAMMLGLVSDAISEKVDSLRKGKSEVIERNHVLILGWSDKLGSLLKQLAIANKSVGGGVVVVLAERDKEEMEMDIAKLEFDFMGTSVICRSGSPLILADLKKVSVSKARAIIVLASDENADQSDARALRVVLSLTGVKERLKGHVVVEMSDLDNEPLVKLVGGQLIETVVAHDVIGRLMIQCALQPGLAQIWEDILGFENDEFYIKRWPQLDGLRFEDVLISFPDAIPCGVKIAADGEKIILNPDDGYILKEGDEILVIAEDDDTYAPGPLPEVHRGIFPRIADHPKYPEKILFCGWRRDIDDMIMVLEAFLAPGSELWIFSEVPEERRERKLTEGGLEISALENLTLVHREGNAVIRRHLESLPLETFDSILILADESLEDSIVHSDSRSLATLLLIRDIQSKRLPYKDKKTTLRLSEFSHSSWISEMQQASDKSIIISEILDSRTRNLVSVSRISDYVLSNELVSMALAMVAEDKQINRVLEELFAEEGNEMCIKPAEFYLFDQEELSFYDIMVRGRQRQEIVIGYRIASAERAVINPPKKSELRKWSLEDVFVVITSGE